MGWQDDAIVGNWKSDKIVKGAPQENPSFLQRAGRYARGLIDEAANLGTGLSDEFGAAVDATIPTQFLYPTSQAETWRQRYDENLANERGRMKQFREENPIAAGTANAVGGVVGAIPTVGRIPALTATGPNLIVNSAKMAGTGAGMGAVQGFGEGEGGLGNRATNAALYGTAGGIVGGLMPIAGAAGQKAMETAPGRYISEKVVSPLARTVAGFLGENAPKSLSAAAPDGSPGVMGPFTQMADKAGNVAESGAVSRLANALQRSGMTPEQIKQRLGQLGPESVLADVDPQFLSAARSAHTMPGQTKTVAKNVLEGRDRQAGNRLTAAFEGSEPPPSAYALRGEGQAFDQNLRAVGQRVYQQMDDAGLKQTPELMALYENPHVSAAIDRVMAAEQGTRVGTNRQPASPIEIMHKVKQAIWDLGFDKETARPGPMASWYRDLGTAYVDALKRANPALREADMAYAQAASLPEFFDAGANLLARDGASVNAIEKSAPALADLLAKADPQQRLAARTGATNAARSQAQESTRLARALAQRIDESAPVQAKLSELYGPEWAGRISNRAAAEKKFAETSNEILRGSKTADKLAEGIDTSAGLRVTNNSVSPRIWQSLGDAYEKLVSANEPVRDAIGRMSLNMDPSEKERLLRLLAAELAKRQQGSPLAASLAGSSGSLIIPNR